MSATVHPIGDPSKPSDADRAWARAKFAQWAAEDTPPTPLPVVTVAGCSVEELAELWGIDVVGDCS